MQDTLINVQEVLNMQSLILEKFFKLINYVSSLPEITKKLIKGGNALVV